MARLPRFSWTDAWISLLFSSKPSMTTVAPCDEGANGRAGRVGVALRVAASHSESQRRTRPASHAAAHRSVVPHTNKPRGEQPSRPVRKILLLDHSDPR